MFHHLKAKFSSVVPALQGLAAPHWRTDVRGAMFGLNRSTSSADIVRASK
ncbi:MAG TPA: hypothetical protein VI524_13070 [Anaerolineales bacterium]|nr:hypothetical protein [Anaerolineales bacterium]